MKKRVKKNIRRKKKKYAKYSNSICYEYREMREREREKNIIMIQFNDFKEVALATSTYLKLYVSIDKVKSQSSQPEHTFKAHAFEQWERKNKKIKRHRKLSVSR